MSSSCSLTYDMSGGQTRSAKAFGVAEGVLDELWASAEQAQGWELLTLELVCEPSGAYSLTAFNERVWRGFGKEYCAVLDPGYLPAEPGHLQEGPLDTAPAGDPETAAGRFREYLRRRAELGVRDELGDPAADIGEAERRLGRPLPCDLRALYEIADGERGLAGLFDGYEWLPLDEVVREHARQRERAWGGWELGWDAVVLDAHPVETVRRCSGHDGWIPFAHDGGGHYLAVDMSPAPKGRAGQVIRIGRDYERGPAYEADSVTALLGRYLRLLDEGEYDVDDEDGWLELGVERAPEPPTSGVLESLPDATALEPSWQELTVNDARRTDLAVLRATPRLRALALNRVTAADLGPLRDLPLEDAALGLDEGGDLGALAAHPTLRTLSVTGGGPVHIAALRTLPRLYGLDLSRTEIADPGVLAGMGQLRFLSLGPGQWDAMFRDGTLPPALAAARLAGEASLAEAIDWAARLGLDVSTAWRRSGRSITT
ncbi:SMI1/KNR4 family protein [Actinomadura miaoliensis]|uniref:SMI1/KNR4 family protein n=1 Tax=Actinomadura miaoliensis TaxID=430685 RepID=UPI0031EEEC57